MKKLPILQPGDHIALIAPASRCSDVQLEAMKALVNSWQLHCQIPSDLFGEDLFCSNNDGIRFKHLKDAIENPDIKAILCARGGYGSMRLIPAFTTLKPPASPKIFVGMSDTTALQLYFQQHWHWPTIHGASAPDRFSPESIAALKTLLFGAAAKIDFANLTALNAAAKKNHLIQATITGGNLSLVQAGIGTSWQLEGKDKIILLEDVAERGYRVDRMLEHLRQAEIFKGATAILFGDFIEGKEPDGSSLIAQTLKRFAESCSLPVVQITGIGHGYTNFPIPLGTMTSLQLGNQVHLSCSR